MSTFDQIKEIIVSDIPGVREEDITPEKRLRDLGADFSISMLIANEVQGQLGVDSPHCPEWFMNQTLANTVAHIDQLLAEKDVVEALSEGEGVDE